LSSDRQLSHEHLYQQAAIVHYDDHLGADRHLVDPLTIGKVAEVSHRRDVRLAVHRPNVVRRVLAPVEEE
jgi:hypothetical protein